MKAVWIGTASSRISHSQPCGACTTKSTKGSVSTTCQKSMAARLIQGSCLPFCSAPKTAWRKAAARASHMAALCPAAVPSSEMIQSATASPLRPLGQTGLRPETQGGRTSPVASGRGADQSRTGCEAEALEERNGIAVRQQAQLDPG